MKTIVYRAYLVRSLVCSAMLATTAMAAGPAVTAAPAAAKARYDQAAQPMGEALKEFGRTSGYTVMVESTLARGLTAPSVQGTYTAAEALKLILASSGLKAEYLGPRTVAIRAATGQDSAASGENPADQMRLAASGDKEQGRSGDAGESRESQVVVQGERDKRKPFSDANVDVPRTIDDPQAYYIFSASDIARSGAVTLEDYLRSNLTMNATAAAYSQKFDGDGARSSFDLRGLGENQTLILINGRRSTGVSLYSNNAQPDLNGIPLSAIDRVEVLPTSASAIYGGGAVGGVINVILKRDFNGGELKTAYESPFDADAADRSADLSYGFSLNQGATQVMVAAGYSDTQPLLYGDRPFLHEYALRRLANAGGPTSRGNIPMGASAAIRSLTGAPLTFKTSFGGGTLGSNVTTMPDGITATTPAATLVAGLRANAGTIDPNPTHSAQASGGLEATLGTPSSSRSIMATLRQSLTSALEAIAEVSYTDTRTKRDMSILTSQYIPGFAASNPFNQDVYVNATMAGNWIGRTDAATRRMTAGLRYELPVQWVAQADFTHARTVNDVVSRTDSFGGIFADLATGALNPFLSQPLSFDKYRGANTWQGASTLNDATLRLAGPVWSLPGGRPILTIGLEHRQSGTRNAETGVRYENYSAQNFRQLYLGKKQVIESAYVELNIPFISAANRRRFAQELNLQLASRREDFTVNTGTESIILEPAFPQPIVTNSARYSSTQPTIGFTYKPVESVLLRASYSGAFLPPTYNQLMLKPKESWQASIRDPKRDNEPVTVDQFLGGDPGVEPETSKSWNAGIILTPGAIPDLRLSVDWYHIEKRNNIGDLGVQQIVDNEALFPGRVVRAAPSDGFAAGRITEVNARTMNLLSSLNEGVDVSLTYRLQTRRYGTFSFNALSTIGLHYQRQLVFGAPKLEYLNYTGFGPLRFRNTSSVIWDQGPWSMGWTASHYNALDVYGPPLTDGFFIREQGSARVPSQTYHDFFARYRFAGGKEGANSRGGQLLQGLSLQVNIENVFDTLPPFDVVSLGLWNYSSWGDARLRRYSLSLRKSF